MVISCQFSSVPRQELFSCFQSPQNFPRTQWIQFPRSQPYNSVWGPPKEHIFLLSGLTISLMKSIEPLSHWPSFPPACCHGLLRLWLWHIAAIVWAIRNLSPACVAAGENVLTWAFPAKQNNQCLPSHCRPHTKMALFFHLCWSGNFTASWMNFLFGQTFNFVLNSVCLGGKAAYSDQRGKEGKNLNWIS